MKAVAACGWSSFRVVVLFLLVLSLSSTAVSAGGDEVEVEAHEVSLFEDGSAAASGDVLVKWRGMTASGSSLRIEPSFKAFFLSGEPIVISVDGRSMMASALSYDAEAGLGVLRGARGELEGIFYRASSALVELAREGGKLERAAVEHGSFTPCDLERPHLVFRSARLVYRPSTGRLSVSSPRVLWRGKTVLYVPYEVEFDVKGGREQPLLLSFRNDPEAGFMPGLTFPFRISGLEGGLSAFYDRRAEGLDWSASLRGSIPEGRLSLAAYYDFSEESVSYSLLGERSLGRGFALSLRYSDGERVALWDGSSSKRGPFRVDAKPELSLSWSGLRGVGGGEGFFGGAELAWGRFRQGGVPGRKDRLRGELMGGFSGSLGGARGSLALRSGFSSYGDEELRWTEVALGLYSFSSPSEPGAGLVYVRRWRSGKSPFGFDDLGERNEVYALLNLRLSEGGFLRLRPAYDLVDGRFDELLALLALDLHCVQLEMGFLADRSGEGEFYLRFYLTKFPSVGVFTVDESGRGDFDPFPFKPSRR